jgi:hypothetical protein
MIQSAPAKYRQKTLPSVTTKHKENNPVNFIEPLAGPATESSNNFHNNHSFNINNNNKPLDDFHHDQEDLYDKFGSVYEMSYEALPSRLKLKIPDTYNSYIDSIKEKFVEQKLKYFPNYLKPGKRKNKGTKSMVEVDEELGKIICFLKDIRLFIKLIRFEISYAGDYSKLK